MLRRPASHPRSRALNLESIVPRIHVIRRQRVMIDADLAAMYGVPTRTLVQAVRRNHVRFPDDFMFILTSDEFHALRSQSVISVGRGGRRYAPLAFTEQGVAMLSSVLRSPRAIQANIQIMRVFVQVRRMLIRHADLGRRLDALERRYDGKFVAVFAAIRELAAPGSAPRRRIGFRPRVSS